MSGAAAPSRLTQLLHENVAVRAATELDAGLAERLSSLRAWQTARLAATYADFSRQPRYAAAVEFFLHELYGPPGISSRDSDLLRVHGVMQRLLPARAVEALTLAVELEVLTKRLDFAVARALRSATIDTESYAAAYRAADDRSGRERQIELIGATGRYLDHLVKRPAIRRLIVLTRAPARAAGFGELQSFLERGMSAFAAMDGAAPLLAAIEQRERSILANLFTGSPCPFEIRAI